MKGLNCSLHSLKNACQNAKPLTDNIPSRIAILNASARATRPRWSEYKIRAWDPTTWKSNTISLVQYFTLSLPKSSTPIFKSNWKWCSNKNHHFVDVFCWIRFIHFSTVRAIFNWVSKEFWDCFGIALLRSVIGPENSHRFLNQSDATLKPITAWSAFSRALGCLVVFTLSSQWLFKVFSFLHIGLCDNTSFGFTTLNRKSLFSSLFNVPWVVDGVAE